LSFGWTRSAQNGFYEAKAKISAENLDAAKARIDVATLKEAAKDLYNKHNKASLKDAVQTIISQNGDILDAQAAKATYEGVDENGNVENKNVLSDYSIATTVIKPLSYNTLRGWNPTSIPGINKVENFINKLFDKIDVKFDFGIKTVTTPEITKIEIKELTPELLAKFDIHYTVHLDSTLSYPIPITAKVPVTITIGSQIVGGKYDVIANDGVTVLGTVDATTTVPGQTIKDTVYATVGAFPLHVDAHVDVDMKEEVKLLYNEIVDPIKDVNKMLGDLEKFMDDINEMLASVANIDTKVNKQIEDQKNEIRDELIGYVERFEKKVLSYASYVNQAMQPVLLYKSTDGLKRVSTIRKKGTKMSGSVLLVPTSFNAELLSPAFKKLVVCTGAWKADGTFDANEAKRVNGAGFENFGKVFEGQERVASFEGKAGYKYRIVYQALDYHGMIASSRYYVQY
jgi:hypothetical protein